MDTKLLKQKILDLAIHGKLVPQNPNDEPASKLLEKIREEKQKLIAEKKIKADKNDSYIFVGDDNRHYEKFADGTMKDIEDEIPFEVPKGWAWCRLNHLFDFIDYRGVTPNKTETGIPLVTAKNVREGYIDYTIDEYISEDDYKNRQGRGIPKKGDLLFTTEAPLGNCALADLDIFSPGQRIITFHQYTDNEYLNNDLFLHFILSQSFQSLLLENKTGTTVTGIKAAKLKLIFIPVPPLREQNKIVSKIKEIFFQINSLETDKSDLQTAVKQTKSKILDLAIHGKLVPQDSSDEPASVLLEKLRAEKEAKIKAGELKRDKNDSYIYKNTTDNCYYQKFADGKEVDITDEIPYEVPSSWEWCRFGDYLDVRDGTHDSPKYVDNGFPFVTSKNLIDGKIDFSDVKYISEKDHKNFIQRSFVEDGDILFAMIGSIGNPVLVKKDREFSIKNVALFKPLSKSINYMKYVFFFADHIQTELTKKAKGGMQPFVPLSFFRKDLWIPIPPLAEQKRIVEKIENFYSILDKIAENLA